MLNRTAKTEREGRTRRAAGIEKYNSNVDRRTSQNGPLIFSAFIAVVVFSCVFVGGFALMGEFNVWWLLGALVVAWAATMCVHIAMQWEKVVIFRFGKFDRMAGPGLYFTIPFIEQMALKADQRIMVTGFGAEETLTSDLVPINVDAVLFWMVWDAKKACLEVENYYNSVSLAAQTALRDAIGRASVSEVAIRRNQLDQELQEVIEERTSVWGITVMSVEIRDIVIPQELQEAMSAEAQAEREKNARMVLAEVEKDISAMLVDAANVYEENELAVRLRTMHLLYESVKNSGGTGRKYILSYLFLYFLTFCQTCVIMAVLGVPYPLLIGFLTAVADVLPVLGPVFVLAPVAVYQLLIGQYARALGIAIGWLVITFIRQVVEPKLVASSVGSGRADLGLVMLPVDEPYRFESKTLISNVCSLVVSRHHPFAKMSSVHIRDLKDETILTYSETATLHDTFIRMCGECGFVPRISYKSLMTRFCLKMVGMQQCIAVLPLPILQPDLCEELVTVPLEPVIPWEIAIIRRREGYRSFAANQLFSHICDHFASLDHQGMNADLRATAISV